MKRIALLILSLGLALTAMAQNPTLRGVVRDSAGEPIVGAFVVEQGTQNGTMTDADGAFAITTIEGATVEISCIGYETRTIVNNGAQDVSVSLADDTQMLEETVVIGYGVQKKSVVTAAIAKVTADELGTTAPLRMDNALKGLAAGVNVTTNSGQPGTGSRIRVRGTGTINNSDPLYIVDGMPLEGGIDYINPNDIESIEVLKDAASGAVYGARAANGVILVTTKKGRSGDAKVNYNFTYGISNPWRMRSVLSASEYAVMINEGFVNAGMAPIYADPYQYGEGTNWQKEVFNRNAPQQSHELSVSGATEKVNYYLSLGYNNQEGIVGGNWDRSNFSRLSLRSNTSYILMDRSKERDFLNNFTLTSNLGYSHIKSKGIAENTQWNSSLGSALALSPILGVYATDPEAQAATYSSGTMLYSPEGKMYMIPGGQYNDMVNPVASLSLPGGQGFGHKFMGNFAGELQIWDNLRFRSSLGLDLSVYGSDGWARPYYLSSSVNLDHSDASMYRGSSLVWQVENVLTYDKTIGLHSFNVLLGQSAKASSGSEMGGSKWDLKDYGKPYINYADGLAADGKQTVYGGPYTSARLASYFFRASYNYDERYMAQFTIRRDGSSRFGENNKWATFPSFSLGWNIHKEPWANLPEWLSMAKARVSWGMNGNENIGDFKYTVLTAGNQNYLFGRENTVQIGSKSSGLANPGLKWETSTQTDAGLDLGFFNNQLTFTVDWYRKITTGMLMEMVVPSYVGETKPWGNVGIMSNSGVEMELGYKHSWGDFDFRANGNLTYLKNKLIEYGNESGFANLDSYQGTGTITRAQNGMPFPYFYGYKTDGIFQNWEEINAYVNSKGEMLQPDAVPGDVRFVNTNGDDILNDEDMTCIGKGTPDWVWGVNLNMAYKGFDLSMLWQGTIGNDIFDATRRIDVSRTNLPSYMLDRWTGEGTSDRIPRFVVGDGRNWLSSDIYIYDGTYARLKNIQLGYTLPEKLTHKAFISTLRLFVSAENLLTFTSYHGYDPEIAAGDGSTSIGIDYGQYPQARTFSFGVNLSF